jgi:hypothetical protein
MPQFNALTGPELKVVIMKEIERLLEETNEFGNHRAFPWVKVSIGRIKILAYPKQGLDEEPEIKTDEFEKVLSEPDAPQPDEQPVVVEIEPSERIIDTPDAARVGAGLPLPTPGLADAGGVVVPGIVDKMVYPANPEKRGPGRPRKA